MAREIEVTPAECPCCRAQLGIDDNLDLHLISTGLYSGKKIETVESSPGWQLNNYFFNQGGRPHRLDASATPEALSEGGSPNLPNNEEGVLVDPLDTARLKEALAKDLSARNIPNPTPTID